MGSAMRYIISASVLLLCASPAWSQQATGKNDARYNSVLWTQNAPEYPVAVRQTYWMAKMQLAAGLANKEHSADEAQAALGDFQDKPPAIILDVDETVLDNSAYNARNIEDGDVFRAATWTAWVNESVAPSVPGAVEFIQHAQGKGVEVFLVTNRRDQHRAGTLKNLKGVGLEVPDDHLLLRNDEEGRGGDKVSRRAMVARDYRIVLLIGDNIADLCAGVAGEPTDLAMTVAAEKQEKFGDGWVMLPNPMYGGWERTNNGLRTQRPKKTQPPQVAADATPTDPLSVLPAPVVGINVPSNSPRSAAAAAPAPGCTTQTIVIGPQYTTPARCNCPTRGRRTRRFNSRR